MGILKAMAGMNLMTVGLRVNGKAARIMASALYNIRTEDRTLVASSKAKRMVMEKNEMLMEPFEEEIGLKELSAKAKDDVFTIALCHYSVLYAACRPRLQMRTGLSTGGGDPSLQVLL